MRRFAAIYSATRLKNFQSSTLPQWTPAGYLLSLGQAGEVQNYEIRQVGPSSA